MTGSVGVVVPLYNGRDTITSALASLAAQTRLPDHVVVVDDGSTDDGADLVPAWSSHLPLTLIRNATNQGPGLTRRTAIEALGTDLVALLDSDDVWLPDGLQLLATTFERHGGLISGNGLQWVPGGALSRSPWCAHHPIPAPAEQLRRLAIENYVFIGSLFERSAYDAIGGFRDIGCEDWDLWLRFAVAGHVISEPEQPTAMYRLRPTSLSANDKTLDAEIAVLERLSLEHPTPQVRLATATGMRHRRARQGLRRSYERATVGDSLGARIAAMGALRGNCRQIMRGFAMLVAPARISAKRAELHADPSWLVEH